jgi:hypothetical protein
MRPGFTGTPRYPDVELKCEYELSKDKKTRGLRATPPVVAMALSKQGLAACRNWQS